MAKAALGKELLVEAQDKKGMLAKISSAIASAGVNIRAICACGEKGRAYFMMVTSNNSKAIKALKPLRFPVKEKEVVLLVLEDKVGAMEKVSEKLSSKGINLKYIYATTGGNQTVCSLVFSSNNNKKAIEIIQKCRI